MNTSHIFVRNLNVSPSLTLSKRKKFSDTRGRRLVNLLLYDFELESLLGFDFSLVFESL